MKLGRCACAPRLCRVHVAAAICAGQSNRRELGHLGQHVQHCCPQVTTLRPAQHTCLRSQRTITSFLVRANLQRFVTNFTKMSRDLRKELRKEIPQHLTEEEHLTIPQEFDQYPPTQEQIDEANAIDLAQWQADCQRLVSVYSYVLMLVS